MPNGLTCVACGSAALRPDADGRLECSHCGTRYVAPGNTCPECGRANDEAAVYCSACGERLKYACRLCGHANPAGAERCAKCGRPLDLLEVAAQTTTEGVRRRLREQMESAAAVKAEEERASQARLEKMWAEERERQRRLAEAAARQAARDRATLQGALLIALGVLAFIVLAAVLMLAR